MLLYLALGVDQSSLFSLLFETSVEITLMLNLKSFFFFFF